jgi:anaerobic magnesium-protoporphyrin IX monomethyl ester cyclase
MNILLIEPPFHRFMGLYRHYYPLGPAYLAGVLNSHGHDVEIFDAEHDPKTRPRSYVETSGNYTKYLHAIHDDDHKIWLEIREELSGFYPDIVGISVLTVKVPSALKIASMCKSVFGDVPIVVGGEHPTARPEDLLKKDTIDYVVSGEGEETLYDLVNNLENSESFSEVDGLSFKNNGNMYHNKNRGLIQDLDSLPYPARELFINKETYRPIDFGLIMGSRGCGYRCSFCPNQSIWGREPRFRAVKEVVNEIKYVNETYSTKYFSFRDYSFSVNFKWATDFCEKMISEKLDVRWECTTRPDLLNEKLIELMKRAGCSTIRLGIESGSEKVLRDIKKDLSLEQVKKIAKILNRLKIYWSAYFMFGLPTETEGDIQKTLELIDEIDPPFVTVARFTPQPGSELFDDLISEGRIREENIDWGQWGNQWVQKSFARTIDQQRFQQIMQDIAERINEHNRKYKTEENHPLFQRQ